MIKQVTSSCFVFAHHLTLTLVLPSPAATLNKGFVFAGLVSTSHMTDRHMGQGDDPTNTVRPVWNTKVFQQHPQPQFLSSPHEGFVLSPVIFWNVKLGLFQGDKVYWEAKADQLSTACDKATHCTLSGAQRKRKWILPSFSCHLIKPVL